MSFPHHLLLPDWLSSEEEWNCFVKLTNSPFRYDILCNDIAHSKQVKTLMQFWEIINVISRAVEKKHDINISEKRNALFSLIYNEEPMYNHIVRERKLREIEAIKGFSIKKSGWLNRFNCFTEECKNVEEREEKHPNSIHKEFVDECEKRNGKMEIGCSTFKYKTEREIAVATETALEEKQKKNIGRWEVDGSTSPEIESADSDILVISEDDVEKKECDIIVISEDEYEDEKKDENYIADVNSELMPESESETEHEKYRGMYYRDADGKVIHNSDDDDDYMFNG